jgi:hypothetical protein
MNTMRIASARGAEPPAEAVPAEIAELLDRVRSLPPGIAQELAPAVLEVIEQARFRGRALGIAKEALERLRMDLELTRFDLELTRKERDGMRQPA